jgi:hypothetical protein
MACREPQKSRPCDGFFVAAPFHDNACALCAATFIDEPSPGVIEAGPQAPATLDRWQAFAGSGMNMFDHRTLNGRTCLAFSRRN